MFVSTHLRPCFALDSFRWKWEVGLTPWTLYSRGGAPRFQWIGYGWAPGIVWTFCRSGISLALPKIEHWIFHRPAHCLVTIKITPFRLHLKSEALLVRCFYTCRNRFLHFFNRSHPVVLYQYSTVIPRLTKIIRSGITFVSRNVISRRFL